MLIPFSEPSYEELKKRKLISSIKKAKHLSDRLNNFLSDIEKSTFKRSDKDFIKNEALKFVNTEKK
jgi:hypothetical protein